jgi:hypothetical protein
LPLLVIAGCGGNPYEAVVEGVTLAAADGVVNPDPGPNVKLTMDNLTPDIPDVPVARLVIPNEVPWHAVQAELAAFAAKNVRPVLLVGVDSDVRAIVLSDELQTDQSIHLTDTMDGKFCVGPPTSTEAKCVQSSDRKHIARAFVRETVRDAVTSYGINDVDAVIPPDLEWGDVVRTIDGVRTCCGDTKVRVKIVE